MSGNFFKHRVNGIPILGSYTTSERGLIQNPPEGLLIYNEDTKKYEFNDGTPSVPSWIEVESGTGSGDVIGPASATDGNFALFDGGTGKLIKDGPVVGALASLNTVSATEIDNNAVDNTKLSDMANGTVKARTTAGSGDPEDVDIDTTFKTALNLVKGDVGLGNVDNTSDVDKPISTATQTALDGKVDENAPITGDTKTKITYDSKGLVTAGTDATTADINPSTDRNYVTDAEAVVIGNTSGTNTGDQTITLTGDVTGSGTGSFAATISNNAVDNTKLADSPANTLKGNNTASLTDPTDIGVGEDRIVGRLTGGNITDLTGTQVTTLIDDASETVKGKIEIATQAEVDAGTDTTKAVTPATLSGMPIPWGNIGTVITPPTITTNQDDYNPSGLSTANAMYLDSSGNNDITGITAKADGSVLSISTDIGSGDIKLKKENTNSLAANRFAIANDLTLQDGHGAILLYVGAISRWKVLAINTN